MDAGVTLSGIVMNPLTPILRRHPIILLDGALATELEQRGCDLRDPLWSAKVLLETPDLIRQVHLDSGSARVRLF